MSVLETFREPRKTEDRRMMKKITIVAQLDKAQPQLKGVANDPKFIILHPEP